MKASVSIEILIDICGEICFHLRGQRELAHVLMTFTWGKCSERKKAYGAH